MIFWLSFTNDSGFLGACLVRAKDDEDPIQIAWDNKCNPGGEVMGLLIEEKLWDEPGNPYELNRLYSKDEINEIDEVVKVDFEQPEQKDLVHFIVEEPPEPIDPSLN